MSETPETPKGNPAPDAPQKSAGGMKGLWPDVDTLERAKAASRQGMWAALLVAGVTAVGAQFHLLGLDALAFFDAGLFAMIGLGLYRVSRVAAVCGLLIFAAERVYMFVDKQITGGVLALVILLAFVTGGRGAFAYHRLRKQALATRRSGRQRIWLVVSALGFSALGLFVVGVIAVALMPAMPGDSKGSFVRELTDSCTQGAVSKGTPEDTARELCGCMAQRMLVDSSTGERVRYLLDSRERHRALTEAVSSCGDLAAANSEKAFKDSYARKFVAPCTRTMIGRGLPEDKGKPFCACMGQFLANNHTSTELVRYDSNVSSPEVRKALAEASAACPQN